MFCYRQAKSIAVTCMAFPNNEINNFVLGSEDGYVYSGIYFYYYFYLYKINNFFLYIINFKHVVMVHVQVLVKRMKNI